MAKRPYPDENVAGAVADAAYFIASLFTGRGVYRTATAETLEGARGEARALETRHTGCGRKAMVYAIAKNGRQAFIPETFEPGRSDG